jgi:glycosyltransferase involved in cell wall biosynthesis
MEIPKVSVIVPTYNHGNWLAECLDSVISQVTNFSFEILVGDDSSTDGLTQNILQHYADRYPHLVKAFLRPSNIGADINVFDLMSNAKGEYIAHLDGDDQMLPGKLQIQADFLDSHPDYSVVAHQMYSLLGKSIKKYPIKYIGKLTTVDLISKGSVFCHSSKMYRKTAINLLNRPYENLVIDFLLHVDHSLSGWISVAPYFLGIYRRSVGVGSSSQWKEALSKACMDTYKYAIEKGVDMIIVKKAEVNQCMRYAVLALQEGHYDKFINWVGLISSKDKKNLSFLTYRFLFSLQAHQFLCKFLIAQNTIYKKIITAAANVKYLFLWRIFKNQNRCQ